MRLGLEELEGERVEEGLAEAVAARRKEAVGECVAVLEWSMVEVGQGVALRVGRGVREEDQGEEGVGEPVRGGEGEAPALAVAQALTDRVAPVAREALGGEVAVTVLLAGAEALGAEDALGVRVRDARTCTAPAAKLRLGDTTSTRGVPSPAGRSSALPALALRAALALHRPPGAVLELGGTRYSVACRPHCPEPCDCSTVSVAAPRLPSLPASPGAPRARDCAAVRPLGTARDRRKGAAEAALYSSRTPPRAYVAVVAGMQP